MKDSFFVVVVALSQGVLFFFFKLLKGICLSTGYKSDIKAYSLVRLLLNLLSFHGHVYDFINIPTYAVALGVLILKNQTLKKEEGEERKKLIYL